MRILLDESLPRPLARLLPEHEVRTVAAMGWTGKRNGELLQLAAGDFDAFLTPDQNLEHQQNVSTSRSPSSFSSRQRTGSNRSGL